MDRAQRRQLECELRECEISEPLQLLPDMLDDAQTRESFEGQTPGSFADSLDAKDYAKLEYREENENLCYYMADDFSAEYKVQRKQSGITCGCHAYRRNRRMGCKHTGDYCRRHGLVDATGGKVARRLEPMIDVYPVGPAATTRKKKALRETPRLLRALAYELCKNVKDTRARTSSRGRPRVPLGACAYALLVKVAYNFTYEDLREDLAADPNFRHLGWDLEEMPHWNTLSQIAAEPALADVFEEFLVTTSRPGRNLDYAIMFDGSGYGTTRRQNWMEQKHGGKGVGKSDEPNVGLNGDGLNKKKCGRPIKNAGFGAPARKNTFIKCNPAVGVVSGLIYALSMTLNIGHGTADNEHFELLFMRTLLNCQFDLVLCDQGYYDEENFELAQRYGKILIVVPKKNAKPEAANTPQLRYIGWLIKHHPAIFRRFYRLRPLIEATFSQKKRKNGHVKLRRRRKELAHFSMMSYPFDMKEKVAQAVRRFRLTINRIIARERLGIAQRNEAFGKAIASNVRVLIVLARKHGDTIDFACDKAFTPRRRVSPPPLYPAKSDEP